MYNVSCILYLLRYTSVFFRVRGCIPSGQTLYVNATLRAITRYHLEFKRSKGFNISSYVNPKLSFRRDRVNVFSEIPTIRVR